MAAGPRRRRWLLLGLLLALLMSLLVSLLRAPSPEQPELVIDALPPIEWSSSPPKETIAPDQDLPRLSVGVYATNISDIDLLDDQFSIELLLWTLWEGDPSADPSGQLRLINGIYDGDIQRFQSVRQEQRPGGVWTLYRIRSAVVKRWQLSRYPFDDQILQLQFGLDDPLQPVRLDVEDDHPFVISPGLLLPGWLLKEPSAYASSLSLMSDLGIPPAAEQAVRRQPTVSFDLPIQRRSLLYVAPDFLGYMLAVGLCCMSLMITRSRDDLILAAVVSAGGNYVFIAGNLPVTAMTGFIGNLQLIVFLGILYVVAADEIIDHHLSSYTPRVSNILRVVLLPSYMAITVLGIVWIIP
ncbi:hypothetical protein [Synechococcus sp. UW140]|uniref:hypothetical protein n=1 Tax=Synechococcus sp. UW140 TaxID=368503 RepID=UPI000E0E74C8|nr:hypothetical protein [Synechococcus sp. UW140]